MSDLDPLPRRVQLWRSTRNQRANLWAAFKSMATAVLILAVSVLGAILVSYGVFQMYPPAGYITGGLMCWLLLWSHERDKAVKR